MPTYEYVCAICGNAWEEIQRITEAPVELCPACHKATAKRQISGGTFILKGGGWYSDLYSSSPKSAPKDDSAAKPDGKADAGGKPDKAEGKTEAKSETKKSEPKGDGGSSSGSGGSSAPAGGGSSSGSGAASKAVAE